MAGLNSDFGLAAANGAPGFNSLVSTDIMSPARHVEKLFAVASPSDFSAVVRGYLPFRTRYRISLDVNLIVAGFI